MPNKNSNVKYEKQSGSSGSSRTNASQDGTTAQKKAAGRKGGEATARKNS